VDPDLNRAILIHLGDGAELRSASAQELAAWDAITPARAAKFRDYEGLSGTLAKQGRLTPSYLAGKIEENISQSLPRVPPGPEVPLRYRSTGALRNPFLVKIEAKLDQAWTLLDEARSADDRQAQALYAQVERLLRALPFASPADLAHQHTDRVTGAPLNGAARRISLDYERRQLVATLGLMRDQRFGSA
jgi:hypothetical protein